MSKKINLSIKEPCHENWNNMSPVDKGKFCGSCQKQVIDFSNMSDREVAQFFKKPSTGSVCGRFMTDQLDRNIEIPRKRIPWLKYFFQILLPAFFMSKASAQIGKVAVQQNRDTLPVKITNEKIIFGNVLPTCIKPVIGDTIVNPINTVRGRINREIIEDKRTIRGKVIDETGDLITGASIFIRGTQTGVASGADATFSIKAKTGDILIVSGVGLETTEICIKDSDSNVLITLKRLSMLNGEVIVVVAGMIAVKRPGKKEKEVPLIPQVIRDTSSGFFKIFPNPFLSGSGINIEWKKQPEEGFYILQFINPAGQVIHQKELWVDEKARSSAIDMPSVAAGNYFLVLINKKSGKKYSEKMIIQ